MALVWLAEHQNDLGVDELVVIKTILPEYSQDLRFQNMFMDEANIAARIVHPNVARLFEVGFERGQYFMVMEWVDGESVSRLHRAAHKAGAQLPLSIALRIAVDVCAGLEAAHDLTDEHGRLLGVVHRDVSPQNVLLGPTGEAKLIDFGVAKARDRLAHATEAGQLKGKLRYMAPEQAVGRPDVDGRADVWSVGAMLYEWLTGEVPFDGPNEVAVLHRLTGNDDPDPLPESVPGPVRRAVHKALAIDPKGRFATARDFRVALEGAMVAIHQTASYADVAAFASRHLSRRAATRRAKVETALSRRGDLPPVRVTQGAVTNAWVITARDAAVLEDSHAAHSTAVIDSKALETNEESRRRWVTSGIVAIACAAMLAVGTTVVAWKTDVAERVSARTMPSGAVEVRRAGTKPEPVRDESPTLTFGEAPAGTTPRGVTSSSARTNAGPTEATSANATNGPSATIPPPSPRRGAAPYTPPPAPVGTPSTSPSPKSNGKQKWGF
jgi:serine/threonine-protein kinase